MPRSEDLRTQERKDVRRDIDVIDAMTGVALGRMVNISEEGFMLFGNGKIKADHLYQLILSDERNASNENQALRISLGAECLWINDSGSGDLNWAGFRIIDIGGDDLEKLSAL